MDKGCIRVQGTSFLESKALKVLLADSIFTAHAEQNFFGYEHLSEGEPYRCNPEEQLKQLPRDAQSLEHSMNYISGRIICEEQNHVSILHPGDIFTMVEASSNSPGNEVICILVNQCLQNKEQDIFRFLSCLTNSQQR